MVKDMKKAILVIDMPDSCKDCDIMFKGDYSDWCPWKDARTDVYDYIKNNTKPDWCPLKELPEKLKGDDSIKYQWGDYEDGWNHCIDNLAEERPYDHIWDMYLDEFEDA